MKAASLLVAALLAALQSTAAEPPPGSPLWQQMQQAVLTEQDPDRVRALVQQGFDINDPVGCGTFSALDGAISKGNAQLVRVLLSLGALPRDRHLTRAAFAEDHAAGLEMVKLLHDSGVSINAREFYASDKNKFTTPLPQATWRGNVELVRYLVQQQAHLDEVAWGEYTALMIAVEKGYAEIFDLLLAAGARPEVRNDQGLNAIDLAERATAGEIEPRENMLRRLKLTASAH